MTDKTQQELRQSILEQTYQLTNKSRFGLFSQPVSTAVGDNGAYINSTIKRDDNNKPITEARNIFTSPSKTSKAAGDFFGPLNSLANSSIQDIYIDPARRSIIEQNQRFQKGNKNDSSFFPASGKKTLMSSAYQYKPQSEASPDPKRKRNQDGNIIIQPRNIVTNPMKSVQRMYLKQAQYISDPYDRANKLQQERLKKQKQKQQQQAFKLNSPATGKLFSKDKDVYDNSSYTKQNTARPSSFNIYNHDAPFRSSSPTKKGLNGFLAPFPKYMQNPEKQKKRKQQDPNKKQAFRGMSIALSRPTPSILCNPTNIRSIVRSINHH